MVFYNLMLGCHTMTMIIIVIICFFITGISRVVHAWVNGSVILTSSIAGILGTVNCSLIQLNIINENQYMYKILYVCEIIMLLLSVVLIAIEKNPKGLTTAFSIYIFLIIDGAVFTYLVIEGDGLLRDLMLIFFGGFFFIILGSGGSYSSALDDSSALDGSSGLDVMYINGKSETVWRSPDGVLQYNDEQGETHYLRKNILGMITDEHGNLYVDESSSFFKSIRRAN